MNKWWPDSIHDKIDINRGLNAIYLIGCSAQIHKELYYHFKEFTFYVITYTLPSISGKPPCCNVHYKLFAIMAISFVLLLLFIYILSTIAFTNGLH
ncbi:hypothetical protein BLOT_007429 [Blomia tropicalis]|nr:hypothetical protein BLOT_007429 [Blomia tropicalis]